MNTTFQTVMLIDDYEVDNYLHKTLLNKAGFAENIVVKNRVNKAIDYLMNETHYAKDFPQVIFLDIRMPLHDCNPQPAPTRPPDGLAVCEGRGCMGKLNILVSFAQTFASDEGEGSVRGSGIILLKQKIHEQDHDREILKYNNILH